jgi:hypothetical protein
VYGNIGFEDNLYVFTSKAHQYTMNAHLLCTNYIDLKKIEVHNLKPIEYLVYQWNVKSLHFAKNYSGTQK